MADTISISSVKRRVRVVGADLEQAVGQAAQAHSSMTSSKRLRCSGIEPCTGIYDAPGGCLRSNDRYLVNYGRWRYKGSPIGSAIAESAVNEVVSWRMAKKRQMRWSDEGANLLAQVRLHDLNGQLHPRVFAFPLRQPKPSHDRRAVVYPMRMAA